MEKKLLPIICFLTTLNSYSQEVSTISDTSATRTHLHSKNTTFKEGFARFQTWYRPFWADMHSTITKGEVAIAKNQSEYDWASIGGEVRPYVFANLGIDAPLWSGNFANGKFGLAFSLPYSVNVWLDIFERTTAPVINVDYRFGAPEIFFIHRFNNKKWLKNYSILLALMKHECTHIGDELSIYKDDQGLTLNRVNVSYNFYEVGITLNDPDGTFEANHAFRFNFLLNHAFWKKNWYNWLPQEAADEYMTKAKIPYELFLQYQYQSKLSQKTNLQGIVSFEGRLRVKYPYPYFTKISDGQWIEVEGSRKEYQVFTANFMGGLRFVNPNGRAYNKIGIGLRAYLGNNPYGQFRNMPFYYQVGLSIVFEQ